MSTVAAARPVPGGEGPINWRRVGSILGGAAAIVVWVTLTSSGGKPVDAWDYWVDAVHPYATGDIHHYLYSPAFAQALAPFHLASFEVFVAVGRAVELACAFWLAGPVLVIALFIPPVATELNAVNINLILVTAIALGFRWPALWSIVLLTKPTMGIGLLWFVVRREWRPLVIAVGTTLAIAMASFLINPGAWGDYIRTLEQASLTLGWPFPFPLWLRLLVALALVAWGARSGRPWTVALAAILSAPRLYFLSPVMLLGLLPLLPHARYAGRLRSRWSVPGPTTGWPRAIRPQSRFSS